MSCMLGGGGGGAFSVILTIALELDVFKAPVAPVAQRYHVTSDTLGREFDPGKRDFSHRKTKK